ncbi:hypothetical protein SEPCBS57363_001619 [Sporothrix epigloea]|uniref:U3 snoRNA associated protein n=1 Tax=Sporothrix epigloea TaxID=1892477 RepID=A0ABP0DBB8_9PEZI
MPANGSPMTRSSTAKLRSKRKSDGLDEAESADIIMTDTAADRSAAASVQDEQPSATKRRKLPVRVKEADEQPEADEVEQEAAEDRDKESDEESDDEAPETVSTVQAAVATRKAAQKASRVADQRAADGKRKRQEKDARLKTQAEARRARDEAAAEAARREEEAAGRKAGEAKTAATVSKLLPLEYLDSDSEDEQPHKSSKAASTAAKLAASRKPAQVQKHKKRHPRDRQLGTTVYRLLSEGGPPTMAPKLGKKSQRVQQDMLVRNRLGKPVQRGFLVRR